MYSVTQYLCYGLYMGLLDPVMVINHIQDKHHAPLPELGLNLPTLLTEAKKARILNILTAIIATFTLYLTFYYFDDTTPTNITTTTVISKDEYLKKPFLERILLEPFITKECSGLIFLDSYLTKVMGIASAASA
jgi:hypothetical protein